LLVTFCVATLRFCMGLLFETAIRFLTANWVCVSFRNSSSRLHLLSGLCFDTPVGWACGSDLKFFSGLRFQTAFILETTVWNRSSVKDCTGLRFETAFLFDSRNLCVNHLCVSTPRIVYDSICDARLVFALWHQKRLRPRQTTGGFVCIAFANRLLILSARILYCV